MRPTGVHPTCVVGDPPESRNWHEGDQYVWPDIHPTALVNAFCTIDAGLPGAPTTAIGARSFLMKGCHLGHNARVGADCELGAHVVLCGHVEVGNNVRIGGSTWVKPRVRIGDGAVIGGGATVVKDVPAGETWVGNPAKPIRVRDHDTHFHFAQAAHVDPEYIDWYEHRGDPR